jgi:hypothetical protein
MDADKRDAQRYRFLKSLRGLEIFRDSTQWTRKDGSTFSGSIVLRGNGTQFGPGGSMDEVIDAARNSLDCLETRLLIKAGVMDMGEKIEWGSASALMREAAEMLKAFHTLANEFDRMHRAVDSQYVCMRISHVLYGDEE